MSRISVYIILPIELDRGPVCSDSIFPVFMLGTRTRHPKQDSCRFIAVHVLSLNLCVILTAAFMLRE